MPVFRTRKELVHVQKKYSRNSVGLVPTMGALHKGHLTLIEKAIQDNEEVWVSIFVNPTQFNNLKDLEAYPVTLKKDVDAIHSIRSDIRIFAPSILEMYPEKTVANTYPFNGLDLIMEGVERPGHFNGVITIVSKLFDAIQPHRAYFGEKDFQQLQIIKNWVRNENIPIQIIPCPIIRESNGLAMSSRNDLLSVQARNEAGFIYNALTHCANSKIAVPEMYAKIKKVFEKHPTFTLHYAVCVDETTLQEVSETNPNALQRMFIAATVEGVRLIDNIALK